MATSESRPRDRPDNCSIRRTVRNQLIAQCTKHSLFGCLDVARMDIERSPVVNDVVLRWRHGNHAHFRILVKQSVTDQRAFAWVVESDHHEIRQSSPYALENLGFVLDFAD